jgi:phosphoribosylformylglycinamidine cyclo-ligase
MPINYRSSGVDVEAGDKLVEWLQSTDSKQIHSENIVGGIGGFASLFRLNFPNMKKPLLVSSTDGVGTKVKLASDFDRLEGVGQDLVAMCVNDLLTTGATPLFFLDYYATGKLDLNQAQSFLKGLKSACAEAKIALVGGETAEMPGIYAGKDFDCAGFSVGIVDEGSVLGSHRVKAGDKVIGISSSGFHSNGYSLLRKVFEKDVAAWIDKLMTPTHLYTDFCFATRDIVNAFANITGSGMDNVPRVVPSQLSVQLKDWEFPENFKEVQKRTGMSKKELARTLNCGIGFVVFVDPAKSNKVLESAAQFKYKTYDLGQVVDEKVPDQIIWPKEWA